MSRIFGVFCCLALLVSQASASLTIVATNPGGQPVSGVSYINFDDPLPSGVTLILTPNAQIVTGTVSGEYAAPYLSTSYSTYFGDTTSVVPGPDLTKYVTTGSTGATAGAKVEFEFDNPQHYFGLLWGSVDKDPVDYNKLEFFDSNGLSLGFVTGVQVDANATGDQGINGTFYVNINSTDAFSKVIATSSQYAFEFDNVAFGAQQIVPEASTIAVWSILSFVGAGVAYRKRMAKA